MIPLLLLGAAIVGGVVLIAFWDDIKKFIVESIKKIKEVIPAVIVGVSTFVKTGDIEGALVAANKFYSKNKNNQWQETVVTRTLDDCDVPAHIRDRLNRTQQAEYIDISNDVAKELKLEF